MLFSNVLTFTYKLFDVVLLCSFINFIIEYKMLSIQDIFTDVIYDDTFRFPATVCKDEILICHIMMFEKY